MINHIALRGGFLFLIIFLRITTEFIPYFYVRIIRIKDIDTILVLMNMKTIEVINKFQNNIMFHDLSYREIDVLRLICQQLTTHEIGNRLYISSKTVERHRSSLFEKTNSKNVVGLVLFAIKHDLIEECISIGHLSTGT